MIVFGHHTHRHQLRGTKTTTFFWEESRRKRKQRWVEYEIRWFQQYSENKGSTYWITSICFKVQLRNPAGSQHARALHSHFQSISICAKLQVQLKFRRRIYWKDATPVWEARRLLGRSSQRWHKTLVLSSSPSAGGDCHLLLTAAGGYGSSGCFWTELWSVLAYALILETTEHKSDWRWGAMEEKQTHHEQQ